MQAGEDSHTPSTLQHGLYVGCLEPHGHEVELTILELSKSLDDEGEVLTLLDTADEEDVAPR